MGYNTRKNKEFTMNNLLMFFEETSTETPQNQNWVSLVVMLVLVVGFFLLTVLPQKRKQKKRDQELAEKMQVGAEIITLGGLVGTIVEMDDQFFWIETGLGENKQVIKMVRQAYHSLVSELPAKDAQKKEDSDQDEIK